MFPWKKYWNEIFSHCVPPPPPQEEGRDLLMGMYTYYVFCGWPLQTLSGWRRKGLHTGLHMQEPTWGFWETTLGQWSGEKILMLIQPYATRPFNHNRSVPYPSKNSVWQWQFAEYTPCTVVNNKTTTLIEISRLFYFGFFSKTSHHMMILLTQIVSRSKSKWCQQSKKNRNLL